MAGMDYKEELKFRDSIRQWICDEIDIQRPRQNYGISQSFSIADLRAGYVPVIPNGESVAVPVAFGINAPLGAGEVVIIDGPSNDRRIVDVVTNSTLTAGRVINTFGDFYIMALGHTSPTVAGRLILSYADSFFIQTVGTDGTFLSNIVQLDGTNFNIFGRNLVMNQMPTTTSAANVRWAGGALYQVTSFSDTKTDIEEMGIDFNFLNLKTYTWRDAQEVEKHSGTDQRYSGTLYEEVRDLGLEIYLSYKEDGEPMGVEESKFYSSMIPLMRNFHMRLNLLEGKDPFDGLK